MTKYFRTVVEVEILSEDAPWDGELDALAYDVRDGNCSGSMKTTSSAEVPSQQMAKLLLAQGSDPEFFQLDENGNPLDEDEENSP